MKKPLYFITICGSIFVVCPKVTPIIYGFGTFLVPVAIILYLLVSKRSILASLSLYYLLIYIYNIYFLFLAGIMYRMDGDFFGDNTFLLFFSFSVYLSFVFLFVICCKVLKKDNIFSKLLKNKKFQYVILFLLLFFSLLILYKDRNTLYYPFKSGLTSTSSSNSENIALQLLEWNINGHLQSY